MRRASARVSARVHACRRACNERSRARPLAQAPLSEGVGRHRVSPLSSVGVTSRTRRKSSASPWPLRRMSVLPPRSSPVAVAKRVRARTFVDPSLVVRKLRVASADCVCELRRARHVLDPGCGSLIEGRHPKYVDRLLASGLPRFHADPRRSLHCLRSFRRQLQSQCVACSRGWLLLGLLEVDSQCLACPVRSGRPLLGSIGWPQALAKRPLGCGGPSGPRVGSIVSIPHFVGASNGPRIRPASHSSMTSASDLVPPLC